MLTRPLRTFTAIYLVAASTIACNPSDPGVTTETTADPTTDVTSTGVTTTSDSSTGEPTTEPPTTGTSTSGDSESATGTTTSDTSTGSTGPLTGDESSSSSGDPSSTGTTAETGDPMTPVSFDECRAGDVSMCPAVDPACLVVDGPGGGGGGGSFFVTWSYCTRECDEDADCSTDLQGGSAKALCVPKGPNDVKVCVLDCSFGKTCPGELECSNDDTCGTRFCDCQGDGCQDFLCIGD
jgi:hypothetical protein